MAYKPEMIKRHRLCDGAATRAKRTAKKAVTRLRRRAERRDPENAPATFRKGWID